MGKMVECKFCGHRFRAPIDPDLLDLPAADEAEGPPATLQDAEPRRGPRVSRFVEQELQKTWALIKAKQAAMIRQIMMVVEEEFVQPQGRGAGAGPELPRPRAGGVAGNGSSRVPSDVARRPGPTPPFPEQIEDEQLVLQYDRDRSEFFVGPVATPAHGRDGSPAPGTGGYGGDVDRGDASLFSSDVHIIESGTSGSTVDLDLDHAERDRLRQEVQDLRGALVRRSAELKLLHTSVEKLQVAREECAKLNAERLSLGRETSQLRNRLVEIQVALVQLEGELDDCRADSERQLAEQRRQFEAERQAWDEQRTRRDEAGAGAGPGAPAEPAAVPGPPRD
jgi:hypothetical protein